jgi:hypothetical protein
MTMIPFARVKQNGKVDLWDMGPQVEPKAPDAPVPPEEPDRTKLKTVALAAAVAEHAAATLEYEDDIERYKDALRRWTSDRKAYRAWKDENGGPVKVEMWGVDARHALDREPERYKLDLPRGTRPGSAQVAADAAHAAEIEELKRAAALDPQFGTQEARAS